MKTNLYYKFIYSFLKEKTHKPANVAAVKNFFSSVYVIGNSSNRQKINGCSF